jgi:hypothetical protein
VLDARRDDRVDLTQTAFAPTADFLRVEEAGHRILVILYN